MNEKLFAATKETFKNKDVYTNYPTVRLFLDPQEFEKSNALSLPDGPWTINDTDRPSAAETQAFQDAGYVTDSDGRPLHPWLKEMITNPEIGVVTGKGAYWFWGPNRTADPIVLVPGERPQVLLIQRGDTGKWALPGGFVDKGETDHSISARRELQEEAGITTDAQPQLIYQDVVADLRTTAHAWAETSAYLFVLDQAVTLTAGDDAKDAQWFYVDELPGELHGSHEVLLSLALERLESKKNRSIRDILNAPAEEIKTIPIDAGHMAYDHMIIEHDGDMLFIKAHDASRFTDPAREEHSRDYLRKEFESYKDVAEQGFTAIPERIDLVNDTLLAMDAYHEKDGWLWGAPEDPEDFDRYVRDVLGLCQDLQNVRVAQNPEYHKVIKPTYETFWEEGWDDLDDDKTPALFEKIEQLSIYWSDDQKTDAQKLIEDYASLKEYAASINRDTLLYTSHNDARQSNIAWHPKYGARIIDWSWADPAPKNADATMFLIDLVKSGNDVSPYIDWVDKDQLVVLTGFWLAHSLWQTRDGSTTVREQQVASASAAHRLLELLPK